MKFEADFAYMEEMFGNVDGIDAIDREDAEGQVMEYVRQTYPEATDIEITSLKETVV